MTKQPSEQKELRLRCTKCKQMRASVHVWIDGVCLWCQPENLSPKTPPVEAVELREQVRQCVESTVQGVQELPKGSLEDYYKQRAGWIDLETDKILELLQTKITKARIEELESLPPYMLDAFPSLRDRIAFLRKGGYNCL